MPAFVLDVLELELAGQGQGWTDVTVDLVKRTITAERGLPGTGPLDRVASTGTLKFALNNSARNSGGKEGYYSPGHADCRNGFDFGIRARWTLTHIGQPVAIASSSVANPTVVTTPTAHGLNSGESVVITGHTGSTPSINGTRVVTVTGPTTFTIPVNVTVGGTGGTVQLQDPHVRFVGRLDTIDPDFGRYHGSHETRCEAVDYMDDLARAPLTGIATLVNQRSDQVFSALIAAMAVQPEGLQVATGLDTFPWALDSARNEGMQVLTELQRVALSELGVIYQKGDGTLVFESRKTRGMTTTNLQTFDNIMIGLAATRSRAAFLNQVRAVAHPRRVDAAATTVLYALQNPSKIEPGETIVMFGPYRDPSQIAARVGGTDMVAPVASTDYLFNAAADGSGADLTASLSVVASLTANGAYFSLSNIGAQTGYVTKLQCRGRGLYDFENAIASAEDATTFASKGVNTLTIDMPYQADPLVAQSAARYILGLHKDPRTRIESLTFLANTNADLMRAALEREISDRIGVLEAVTGITTTIPGSSAPRGFFINGIRLVMNWPELVCTFTLAPTDENTYWRLGVTGASELGLTTRLGYGIFVGHEDTPHQDGAHVDSAHVDTAHVDVAHADVAHQDGAHADVAHADAAHADTAHSDVTHSDVNHNDVAHGDTVHTDIDHSDTPHGDTAHTDVPHGDFTHHTDHTDDPIHQDSSSHNDWAHDDVPHADDAHQDAAHADVAHADVTHQDTPHDDVAHVDVGHSDAAHDDVAHTDASHADVAHQDGAHTDTPHTDTPHGDQAHSDVGHGDAYV